MPFLFILSSPSGGGKSTIARRVLEGRDDLGYSVSATTRPRREGEVDGTHYHFLSEAEFERRVKRGDFLEHARYGGYRYGTLVDDVQRIVEEGKHAILDIEIEGARQVRRRFPEAVLVFLLPPSGEVLAQRLRGRKTDGEDAVARRLERAAGELGAVPEYDYVVVNDDLVSAVGQVAAILEAEAHRVSRRDDLGDTIDTLQREVRAEGASPAGSGKGDPA